MLGLVLALELVLHLHAGHLALHLALHVLVVAQLVVHRLLALEGPILAVVSKKAKSWPKKKGHLPKGLALSGYKKNGQW